MITTYGVNDSMVQVDEALPLVHQGGLSAGQDRTKDRILLLHVLGICCAIAIK